MTERVRPARPHTGVTESGRRVREVLSYARRGNRLTDRQAAAWERRHAQWWLPDEAADDPRLDIRQVFGRDAPLVVEIGSGVGEATAALAALHPEHNVLAFEVWRPGVAQTFLRLEERGVENVRLMSVDAVWSLEQLLGEGTVSELWTFFPDPWPKQRHQRRRLVGPEFAHLAATRLAPGGLWRLATDWAPYADRMAEVLDAEPLLENPHGGPSPRWAERPVTRFERRGLRAGHTVTDFTYRRRATAPVEAPGVPDRGPATPI